ACHSVAGPPLRRRAGSAVPAQRSSSLGRAPELYIMVADFSEGGMAGSHSPFSGLLRDRGSLMVAGAGESVTMVKRSAPEQALKLKKTDEWKLYLEFLKVMFNLADR